VIGFVFKTTLAVCVLAGTIGVVMAAVGQGHGSSLAREVSASFPKAVVTPVGKGLDVAGSETAVAAARKVHEWSGMAIDGAVDLARSVAERRAEVNAAARRAADSGETLLHPPLEDDGGSVGAFVEQGE